MFAEASSGPRVAITGYGLSSAVSSLDEAFFVLALGKSLATELVIGSSDVRCVAVPHAIEAPLGYLKQRKWLKYMGGQTQLAVTAAGHALTCANLQAEEPANQAFRRAMALGIATGPIAFDLEEVLPGLRASRASDGSFCFAASGVAGLRATPPMMPFHTLLNMPVGLVSMIFGICGHNSVFYPDSEQCVRAISMMARGIKNSRFDSALVGGTAELFSVMPLGQLRRCGWLAASAEAAVPFEPRHLGWAITNASSMLVLEGQAQAEQRKATVRGWLECDDRTYDDAQIDALTADSAEAAELTIVTGTRDIQQDARAVRAGGGRPCISLDAIIGYCASASPAIALSAACRLLEKPNLYQEGRWYKKGTIAVLCAHNCVVDSYWSRLIVEAAS